MGTAPQCLAPRESGTVLGTRSPRGPLENRKGRNARPGLEATVRTFRLMARQLQSPAAPRGGTPLFSRTYSSPSLVQQQNLWVPGRCAQQGAWGGSWGGRDEGLQRWARGLLLAPPGLGTGCGAKGEARGEAQGRPRWTEQEDGPPRASHLPRLGPRPHL